MKVKTNILKPAFATLAICVLILATLPSSAFAQSVKIISGSPGDTLSFSGTGKPDSQVRLEVSATIDVGTTQSGDKYYYRSSMNGLHIPGGNSMSITVSPVDTLTVSGSFSGVPVGMSMDGSVSDHVGSFSRSVPAGTYNIVVTGIANGSSSSVSMTVRASQPQDVGTDGTFTAGISTSGLPSTVYTVTQDGNTVAMVYLGVQAPAASTPGPTPSPTANATIAQNTQGNMTSTVTASVTPSPAANASISPSSSVTTTPAGTVETSGSGISTWVFALVAILFGTVLGVAVAYLFVRRNH